MQPPADAKREGELSERLYFVREQRDAKERGARNKNLLAVLAVMAALAVEKALQRGRCSRYCAKAMLPSF